MFNINKIKNKIKANKRKKIVGKKICVFCYKKIKEDESCYNLNHHYYCCVDCYNKKHK